MDKKSKILLIILLLLAVISIYLTYRRSFIVEDYNIIDSSAGKNAEGGQ